VTLLLLAPIGLPLLAATGFAVGGWRRLTAGLAIIAIAAMLAAGGYLAFVVNTTGPVSIAGGYLRADALTAWMLLVVSAVSLLAIWASPAYLAAGPASRPRSRRYGVLFNLFVAAMATAVLSGNLGVLWVVIEATTIVTAFLVGHHGTRTALEAAWKYVLICSAAIAIAFLGLILLYYAARHAGLDSTSALDWTALTARADHLDPAVTRIAIGLLVLGFGAKAGLIPLHAWLPDAHSQAPAPVSALMSGVLLSVAFYAVLRFKAIADPAAGTAFLRTLLVIMALVTLAVAATLLIGQRDFKRMLAYSSMEHMGLIALGAAVGSRLAIAAILLHMAGHGLAKAVAFLSSGHILHRYHSSEISSVRGLAATAPALAVTFGLAIAALLGFPPAAVFVSELGIARAGANANLSWAIAIAFVLALLAFAAITAATGRMLLGPPDTTTSTPVGARTVSPTVIAPLLLGLLAVAALGISTGPLAGLLDHAASIIGVP
jgi:hydrogenase-4 component F